ncbi:NYN domain-containing protein [Microbacterium binotii]|uniref:NYN domain-containing protein n=1 Tax=Microbacterium binotii TaxID=462710 RepID=UPI001F2300C7|nr:NYN domain-containing protein [Microbacterium binotii]UIN31884.1 NYN domain-containing protein [Microbacterium binotii]
MASAHLFIDYQNTHITGWENYAPWNTKPHEHLVHPGRFATEIEAQWLAQVGEDITIAQIHVFRGLADPRKQSTLNSAAQRQHRMWQLDPRTSVHTRALRYPRDWPTSKAQEKGVDVMLALAVVRCALARSCDRVLVSTRDTDILPAIDMAEVEHPGALGLVSWDATGALKPTNVTPTVLLDAGSFAKSEDPNTY